jgi:hypothetical protein
MHRIGFIITVIIFLASCTNSFKRGNYGSYTDNLEDLSGDGTKVHGKLAEFRVGDLPQIQRDTVRSGKNAIRLDTKYPYGLNYKVPGVKTDEYIEVSVWYSGPGQLVLVASHKDAGFYYRKSASPEPAGDEWKELKLAVSVPPSMNREDLNIYVWNPGQLPVYADDFNISYSQFKSYPEFSSEPGVHLLIDTLDMLILEQKRDDAFKNGILETEDDDYVPGLMYYNDSIMPVEVRLKGDWLDHLEGRKWSFRIKVKKQHTWKNMRAFSLQTPISRDFLNEYVSHRLFRENDLLAPRYGFVPVNLNGTSLGIYAWEEHFEKQLVESLKRREGPILKFDESLFWVSQKVYLQESQYFELPFLQASDIQPFKLNRTLETPALRSNFVLANNLMNQYKFGEKKASEIFDVNKLAAYYAFMDLTRGFHGLAWHNQRYYYNPVLCKLEPIFFDAYTEDGVFNADKNAISGLFEFNPNGKKRFENLFWVEIFQDSLFREKYIGWLEKISDPAWINKFLQEQNNEVSLFESWIAEEFEGYHYDRGFLLENARKIRIELPYYKNLVKDNPGYADFDDSRIEYIEYTKKYDPRFPEYYLNAYLKDSTDDNYIVQVDNFYPHGVDILGYGDTKDIMDQTLDEIVSAGPYQGVSPESREIRISIKEGFIVFRIQGQKDLLSVQLMQYPPPVDYTPEQELFLGAGLPEFPFIQSEGDKITFMKGKYTVDEPLIVPPGYKAFFEAGCEIDFVREGFFISKSPVLMLGEAGNPVVIRSSDNTAMGFTVLQADDLSRLENVVFEGLNTLNYNNWMLTGAVNFYESNVHIETVEFRSNVCEDALNIIRSEFQVSNSLFSNTFADAFDSDFCTGTVQNVTFTNPGNDAIDFSGSVVEIVDCRVTNAGDKGVSCGEGSTLTVRNTTVNSAIMGYAAKDNSVLNLDNCSTANVQYALAAYQKKPEYGPGSIEAKGFKAEKINELYIIEKFSTLVLNGTIVTGEATKVAELFY